MELLDESNIGRVPQLIPLRYQRMSESELAFLRGSPGVMIADLATTAVTGIQTQLCGDCHLSNFGWFGTPERNLIFDVTDFDETRSGPWEWDVKRLATSFAVAARAKRASREDQAKIARDLAEAYRTRIAKFSRLSEMELWYERLDSNRLIATARSDSEKKELQEIARRAEKLTVTNQMDNLITGSDGSMRIADKPLAGVPASEPLVTFHTTADFDCSIFSGLNGEAPELMRLLHEYRKTLSDDRRALLDRFRVHDTAFKAVGVGSVGMRCGLMLLADSDGHCLLLQLKEARASLLDPFLPQAAFATHHGRRVVDGQRLMQAASDLFLGWTKDDSGRDYYVRQLRDMKTSMNVDKLTHSDLRDYADLCGWALARAHAKAGNGAVIAGYLGEDDDNFDRALGDFAVAYADQVALDYARFKDAMKSR